MVQPGTIRKNLVYGTLLRLSNVIFPLVTFPYAASVLLPAGLGKVDFSLSVVQYFVAFSQLGIPAYAVRECAKVRDNKRALAKCVQELLIINIVIILVSYIGFFAMIGQVERFAPYRSLLVILSINIVMTSAGVEWFYHSIEEYAYITKRSVFVKFVSVVLVFLFIKTKDDYILYGAINVLSVSLACGLNFWKLVRTVPFFARYSAYNFRRHLKPIVVLFGSVLSISVYNNMDTSLLGVLSGDAAVGIYSAANKLVRTVLPFVTTLSVILVPRISYLVSNRGSAEAAALVDKSFSFVLMLAVPAGVGLYALAVPLVFSFFGPSYAPAATTLQILSVLIPVIGVSNLLGGQVLVAYGREKFVFVATFGGAVVSVLANLLLVPHFRENGAAASALLAESVVLVLQLWFAYPIFRFTKMPRLFLHYGLGGVAIFFICFSLRFLRLSEILTLILGVAGSVPAYFGVLLLFKEPLVSELLERAKRTFTIMALRFKGRIL